MKQNKETLKQFFETGDKPTQQQYADLIDSYIDSKQEAGEANRRFVIDETGEVSVASELTILQSDWNQIDNTQSDFIKNKPDLTNIGLQDLQEVTNQGNSTSNDVILRKAGDASSQTILFDTDGTNVEIGQLTTPDTRKNITTFFIKYGGNSIVEFAGGDKIIFPQKAGLFSSYSHPQLYLENRGSNRAGALRVPSLTADRTYTFPDKDLTLAGISDIPVYQAGTNITIDNTNPLQPIINGSKSSIAIQQGSYSPVFYSSGSSFTANVHKAEYYAIEDRIFVDIELTGASSDGQAINGNVKISLPNISGLYALHEAVGSVFNKTTNETYNCSIDWESGLLFVPDKVLTSDKLLISINYKHGNRSFS